MRIAIISPVRHPISAPFMGGMEAHSYALAGALVARGHEVALFASGDSHPPEGVELYPITSTHFDGAYPSKGGRESDVPDTHLDRAFAGILPKLAKGGFDIIHNNSLHRYPPRLARRERIAMLTSLHVPPLETLREAVHDARAPWCRFTVCTGAQRERWAKPDCDLSFHVVPNGIDTGLWGFCPHADGSAVWFGRITPNKGTAEAVKAARIAELPLRIYGPIEDRAYFDDTIAPYLGSQITYGGNLTAEDLSIEVARASVCFFTPVWDEPFGLAAAEAMSCGVPVAAFDSGAVREVVGEAGVIVPTGDVAALADAARKAMTCDRQFVRDRAVARFGVERMIDRYEELYRMCMAGLSETAPEVDFAPDDLPPAEVTVRLAVK